MIKKRLGLVLGRFQPLHLGHILYLIGRAFRENDRVIICIGSAQKSDPLPIIERHERMEGQLKLLSYLQAAYRIVDLIDPIPMNIWPSYVKQVCGITDETSNTFYRSDILPKIYEKKLIELGFKITIVPRVPFYYKGPDGFYRLVDSASDIRRIHRELGGKI